MDNWVLETADGERETIAEGTILYPFAYYIYSPPYQWLDNSDEAIILSDSKARCISASIYERAILYYISFLISSNKDFIFSNISL